MTVQDLHDLGGRCLSPDHVIVGGVTYECDTNGWAMVLRPVASTTTSPSTGKRADVETRLASAAPPPDAARTTVEHLAAQLGPAEIAEGIDHPVVAVLDEPFNGNLMAGALEYTRATGPCAVWLDPVDGAILIAGEGWRVAVMPMRHDTTRATKTIKLEV